MDHDHLTDRDRAVDYLAARLQDGTLALLLGAGVSEPLGFPVWRTLVSGMAAEVGVALPTGTDADALQKCANSVKAKCGSDSAFMDLVYRHLYSGRAAGPDFLGNPLLGSIGSLLMGRRRGNVQRVMTLNFDSNLEEFAILNGLVPRIVTEPPQLEGAEDVRVYHAHGFLPRLSTGLGRSQGLTFTATDVNLRLGTPGDPWFELMRHFFGTCVGLAVGLSLATFRDRAIAPLLAQVGKAVRPKRPTCFWLVRRADRDAWDELLAANVVPIEVDDAWAEVPVLLRDVCRKAADSMAIPAVDSAISAGLP